MDSEHKTEPNLFGVFVAKASRLIDFHGLFLAAKEEDQEEATKAWNEFVDAYDAIAVEFAENMRAAIIESGEYEELPNGNFLRKPDILDEELLEGEI